MTQQETSSAQDTPEPADDPIQVVLVSGFLGAGKTTALRTIGERLLSDGYTVGMITNDQASGLVDTSILDATEGTVVEIPGGCFCCNFTQLLEAAHTIGQQDVDILLAEPVGSCTDLVATVVNPLRSIHAEEFAVAPLTVMLDPDRVRSYLTEAGQRLPEEVRYIFRLQIEEADVVVLNKTDTLDDEERSRLVEALETRVGERPVIPISAAQQERIDTWLSTIFTQTDGAFEINDQLTAEDRALTDIDYDTYAEGEAKLGWVNMTVECGGPFDVARFRTDLMKQLQQDLRASGIEVAHLKFSLAANGDLCYANLTSTAGDPRYSGAELGTVTEGRLVVNVRAVGAPDEIQTITREAIDRTATTAGVTTTIEDTQAFRPEYPEPVHRIDGESDATADGSPPSRNE